MDKHGFYRVAAASPRVAVADPARNKLSHESLLRRAQQEGCELVVFPELSITGYTCGDLFASDLLLQSALESLRSLTRESADFYTGVFVVGLPLRYRHRLYNVAAVIHQGKVLGLVGKRYIPNYREFYEQRWFEPAPLPLDADVDLGLNEPARFTCRQVFRDLRDARCVLGVEICEDLWVPSPPSSTLATEGATVLINLSASNEVTTKADYRRSLVLGQSARCIAGYVYAASHVTESTTDLVFGGHSMIAENGSLLAEAERFERDGTFIIADLDLGRLSADRALMTTFTNTTSSAEKYFETLFHSDERPMQPTLRRPVPAHPFVPATGDRLHQRCEEIFHIQVAGLAKRLEKVQPPKLVIGVSGGLDSTLALLVAAKAQDRLKRDRSEILGITMPGFGTSERTRTNALSLMQHLQVSMETIDIKQMAYDAFQVLGHRPFGLDPQSMSLDAFTDALAQLPKDNRTDLVFENVQARTRTLILMSRGFVVGTGDLSELALGWTTYNADHMSMYNPNAGVPKTLVRFLVRWVADHEFKGGSAKVLHSIADTPISPEMLPITSEGEVQRTEDAVGPYELNDFFLYHLVRFGFAPSKIVRLARQAEFDKDYSPSELKDQLKSFLKRFFSQQFKRSCLPDGPKVGSICLSPRGDWRMPSDAEVSAWIAELDNPL